MRHPRFPFAHHRLVLALPFALAAHADRRAGGRRASHAGGDRGAAGGRRGQKDAQNAKAAANNADTALSLARSALAAANAHLALINTQISALKATIAADTATLRTVNAQLTADRGHLSAYLRQSYESGGSQAMLAYIISANTIAAAIQRDVQVNEISSASQQLVARIGAEEQKASTHARTAHRRPRAARRRGGAGAHRAGDHQGADPEPAGSRTSPRTHTCPRRRRRSPLLSPRSPPRARAMRSTRRSPVRCSPSTPT